MIFRTAASHDILEFRRCSCNALKPKAILAAPKTPMRSQNPSRLRFRIFAWSGGSDQAASRHA